MRFDLVTIFPDYFAAVDVSLLGKAQQAGQLRIDVHDLRHWASGKHRSVDAPPAGGGAGMLMRPDVWGSALDEILSANIGGAGKRILAIPTPAGSPLTQEEVRKLATADQIVIPCGRYEGIDSRVSQHYRSRGVEVIEYSLGDYVLNGGEVAALALVEAVGRLHPDVIGNPESLVEESHWEGLLESPAYTQPRTWRGLETPQVLLSGDHRQIASWRRQQSLAKTAQVRPDMVAKLNTDTLSSEDLTSLATAGYLVKPEYQKLTLRVATKADIPELTRLARSTFPDACPPQVSEADIAAFSEKEFTSERFAQYCASPEALLLVAEAGGQLVSYTLSWRRAPTDLQRVAPDGAYISKCYTDVHYRGSGVTAALLERTVSDMRELWAASSIVIATHISNRRAAKFYRKHGFRKKGRRHFQVGDTENIDDVFVLDITDE